MGGKNKTKETCKSKQVLNLLAVILLRVPVCLYSFDWLRLISWLDGPRWAPISHPLCKSDCMLVSCSPPPPPPESFTVTNYRLYETPETSCRKRKKETNRKKKKCTADVTRQRIRTLARSTRENQSNIIISFFFGNVIIYVTSRGAVREREEKQNSR